MRPSPQMVRLINAILNVVFTNMVIDPGVSILVDGPFEITVQGSFRTIFPVLLHAPAGAVVSGLFLLYLPPTSSSPVTKSAVLEITMLPALLVEEFTAPGMFTWKTQKSLTTVR